MSNELQPAMPDRKNAVYVSPNEMVLPYRPFAELEHWVKYRLDEKSNGKTLFVQLLVVAFFLLGGPIAVLNGIAALLSLLTTGSASAPAVTGALAATCAVVTYFYAFLAALGATWLAVYYTRPTHLSLSDRGVRLLYRPTVFGRTIASISGSLVSWTKIERIRLTKPEGKDSPTEQRIAITAHDKDVFSLRLGAFLSTEDRSRVLEAIEKWSPQTARDSQVVQALEPPADYSYTELWMKALSAPPKRERLKPLALRSLLRDGKYEIDGALGVGGQGTAYLAYDIAANRDTVVLKEFILPVYVDISVRKQALDKFEKEAKILKQLDHPQVVKLVDFFVEDHRGYLVLEHIDGMSLRDKVSKEGRLNEDRVRGLAAQMCTILHYLHGLTPSVVHRDFTPDNLILRKDGTLKLVDFNVAQQTESTATGTVVGKHAYLPPEQFRGNPSTRSDLYAMGATMHFLLTGEDPEPISVAHPREFVDTVSVELDHIISGLTQLDETVRVQRAEDVAAQLRGLTALDGREATTGV